MAIELNKKKYMVLCVMLILLNYHINGAKGAESQDSKKGSNEPQPLQSGSRAETPENGSKSSASQISNNGSKTPESQVSKKGSQSVEPQSGSKAEAPENGSKSPASRVSNSGPRNPDSQVSKNGSNIAEPGSKAEAPENGSKASISQVSNTGPKTPESQVPENGSKAAKPPTPKSGSIAMSPEYGSKNPASQIPASQIPDIFNEILPENMTNGGGPYQIIKIPENGTKPGQPQVPCYFIFGDSLVDAGNNNILKTLARADYDPYGIDFKPRPGHTGRFSNGKTVVDVTAELLGFDHYIPPSELTNGTDILKGLNFASAAAGIREETAQHLGDRMTMREQVESFRAKVSEMAGLLGGQKKATDHLGKCLFSVGLGSNDYLNNYFIPNLYPTSKLLTPEQYADDLIKQYTTHLMTIYNLGARKFALNGVSQVGCSPNSLAQYSPDGTCVKRINDANEMFNTRLKTLVDTLNKDHPDAKFTYVNSFGLFQELKEKAATYGFKVTTDGCCGIGKNNGLITCLPGITPCQNRNEYIFWDAYHPTEATNIIGAKRSYIKQLPTDAYPYDIHTLITL